jgi:hypothetical protein
VALFTFCLYSGQKTAPRDLSGQGGRRLFLFLNEALHNINMRKYDNEILRVLPTPALMNLGTSFKSRCRFLLDVSHSS